VKRYLVIFLLLLTAEIAIALLHIHKFVRGFVGDLLVIPLLYSTLKLISKGSTKTVLLCTVTIAFGLELAQYIGLADILGIQNKWLRVIIGTTYDPLDLLAYSLGATFILMYEYYDNKNT